MSILLKSKKFVLWTIAVFLAIGAGITLFGSGSGGLLSQFSGFDVTPSTASSSWRPTPSNPYRADIESFSKRVDGLIVHILDRGSGLAGDRYVTYLRTLVTRFEAMAKEPQYASDREVASIVNYLNYELTDAAKTFSLGNLVDIVNTTADELSATSEPIVPVKTGTLTMFLHSGKRDTYENISKDDAYDRCVRRGRLRDSEAIGLRCEWQQSCFLASCGNGSWICHAGPTCPPAEYIYPKSIGTLSTPFNYLSVDRSLLLAGSHRQKIAAFLVTANDDAVKLKNVVLTGSNLDALFDFVITDASGSIISEASNITSTGAVFTNIDSSSWSIVGMGQTSVFYVVADIVSSIDRKDVAANIVLSGSSVIWSDGAEVPMNGADVSGPRHVIAQNTFKVDRSESPNRDLATGVMEFTVSAYGRDKVTLSIAKFNNFLRDYAGGTLTIVRKNDNVVVGTGTGVTGEVRFNSNATIDAGSSSTYVVKFVWADPAVTSWMVIMQELQIGWINASDYYPNRLLFPIASGRN